MYSIKIIIPYFGTFPPQFKFWWQSALNNSSISFLIITDNKLQSERNIEVLHENFSELKNEVQNKFNFNINLDSPYKLCDFKGAYGYIFEKYLKGFDFWGFGDLDLVYGDIRHFITDEILKKYDIISGWGHFTLYRNNNECNFFFQRKEKGYLFYEDVFKKTENCVFDEFLHKGLSDRWQELYPSRIYKCNCFDDIIIPRKILNFVSFGKTDSSLIFCYANKKLYRIFLERGKIIKEQSMYVHFQQRKFMRIQTYDTQNYLIIPNRFINYRAISRFKLVLWGRKRFLSYWLFRFKLKYRKLK